jgi:3-isopropylmalate dehydrogenase
MKADITIMSGDGVGPEITREAVKALQAIGSVFDHDFSLNEVLFGGIAIDETGTPYPEKTQQACKNSDAVLLGAVGGPKWSDPNMKIRPEKEGLLEMRADLGIYANIRPIKTYQELIDNSPIKNRYLENIDMVFVRELTGGIYFGEKKKTDTFASDICEYSKVEIERITRVAANIAQGRRKKITSVDKANVMATSQLWRSTTTELIEKEYSELELEHIFIDAATMHLLSRPADFDVILTDNLFGDILTDEAAMLTGSIGMLPSACLGEDSFGVYEPIHGSAPDIANQGIANPCGAILSVAMLLQYSLSLEEEAQVIEQSVAGVIEESILTKDLTGSGYVSTEEMGTAVTKKILQT